MSPDSEEMRPAAANAAAVPLDLLLTDAAVGLLRRVNPGGSGVRLAAGLAARPRLVAGRGRRLLGELTRIAAGRSQVEPSRRDRRFADPGWTRTGSSGRWGCPTPSGSSLTSPPFWPRACRGSSPGGAR